MKNYYSNMLTQRWIKYFFDIADVVAKQSKDPSTKTGAVLVSPSKQIIACGYNGFPSGYTDDEKFYTDREYKYPRIVHAEINALCSAAKHGISTKNASIFVVPIQVCNECAKAIIQAGIKNVYCKVCKDTAKWTQAFEISKDLFTRCGVNFYAFDENLNCFDKIHTSEHLFKESEEDWPGPMKHLV